MNTIIHERPRDFNPSGYISFASYNRVEEPVPSEFINDYIERTRLNRTGPRDFNRSAMTPLTSENRASQPVALGSFRLPSKDPNDNVFGVNDLSNRPDRIGF